MDTESITTKNKIDVPQAMIAALEHAHEGRPVFPCQPDKKPYTGSGFKDATTNEDQIIHWWTEHPDALIGMPTGSVSGIDVLDIDVKSGHDGEATLRNLEAQHGAFPEATEVMTQSGGRHLWVKHTEGLRNSAGKLGDGLDVRADGGYVIVPGSGNYEYLSKSNLSEAPAWMIAGISVNPVEQPTLAAISASIKEGGRNATLTKEAGRLRRNGLSAEVITAALLVMNREQCHPPLSEEEVRTIAQSVSRYAPEPTGDIDAYAIPSWTTLAVDPQEATRACLTPTCIVDQYLYADVAQIAAPGGTGKTTLLLWEAAHIALGRTLWGLNVETPGKVLIVTAEDERERLAARLSRIVDAMGLGYEDAGKVYASIGIYDVAGSGIKLTQIRDGNIVLTAFADNLVEALRNDPPVMVVFDPLVSFGASEQAINDNEQNLVMAARRIVKGLGCCVRLVHHTGKQNARDATLDQYSGRGGSALADGSRMTAIMQVWRTDSKEPLPEGLEIEPEDSVMMLNRAKLSYSPPNRPLWFIRRRGFVFECFEQDAMNSAQKSEKYGKQTLEILRRQIKAGIFKSKTELEESMPEALHINRNEYRKLVQSLLDSGKLVTRDLPKHLIYGRKKEFYCPADIKVEDLKVVPLKDDEPENDTNAVADQPFHSAEPAAE